jgi:3-isopropylmalate dehydrogenase
MDSPLTAKFQCMTSASSPQFQIAVMPGDGIGPEVINATLQVLHPLCEAHGIRLKTTNYDFGAGYYRRTGRTITAAEMDEIGLADAVLFGAMGLPDVRKPDGTEVGPQVDMRAHFGLFASLRPARLYPGVPTRLRADAIDMLVIRETTEGMFAGLYDVTEPSDESASDRMTITRKNSIRLFEAAFAQARQRKARGTPGHVTLLHKSNALRSNVLLTKVFDEVAARHPDIGSAKYYIDAGAMYFVTSPERYDVVVTENIFGDIVSEIGAGIVGGLGVAPSGDVSETRGVFQPSHGSAPDIAGQGIANPVATMLSAVMMLEWLGTRHHQPACRLAAEHLHTAIAQVLRDGPRCRDLGGTATTAEVTQAVIAALKPATVAA